MVTISRGYVRYYEYIRKARLARWLRVLSTGIHDFNISEDFIKLNKTLLYYSKIRELFLSALREETTGTWIEVRGWCHPKFRADFFRNVKLKADLNFFLVVPVLRFDLVRFFGRKSVFWGFRIFGFGSGSEISTSLYSVANQIRVDDLGLELHGLGRIYIDSVQTEKRISRVLSPRTRLTWARSLIQLAEIYADFELAEMIRLIFDSTLEGTEEKLRLSLVNDRSESIHALDQVWKRFNISNIEWTEIGSSKTTYSIPIPQRGKDRVSFNSAKGSQTGSLSEGWALLRNARIMWPGIITVGNTVKIENPAQAPQAGFAAGLWNHIVGSHLNLGECYVQLPRKENLEFEMAINLLNRVPGNWFHWMIETLPQILVFEEFVDPDVPVIISSAVPDAGIEALRLLTNRKIVTVPEGQPVETQFLYVSKPLLHHSDSTLPGWGMGLALNKSTIERAFICLSSNVDNEPSSFGSYIFLFREDGFRGIRNQAQLMVIARSLGFEIVDPTSLTIQDQIILFRNAKVVVGAGGAVMANYLFMAPGTTVVGLYGSQIADYQLPAILCSWKDVEYISIAGNSIPSKSERYKRDVFHRDFHISPSTFAKVLKKQLSKRLN